MGFYPGFNFDFIRISQETGWEERLRYDSFNGEWDVKLY